MGIVRRNRAFLITAALILVVGAALFGGVVAVRVLAVSGSAGSAFFGETTVATLSGPDLPASTDQATFEAQMASTAVFSVYGTLTITADVTPDKAGDTGVVEGYLVPGSVPRDSAPSSPEAMRFDLTGQDPGRSESWDLGNGNYYVIAAGQDCTWTLTMTMTTPSYNSVSSYGMTGYAPLKLVPTDQTPDFIKSRLAEQRGLVLLVYAEGAADDMEMLSYFNDVKAQYGADSSFMAFEARKTTELGDTLDQLRVSNPPILAVIRGSGEVSELYTGWIGRKVMEQVVADAVRGL
jgi:hypothetical protein